MLWLEADRNLALSFFPGGSDSVFANAVFAGTLLDTTCNKPKWTIDMHKAKSHNNYTEWNKSGEKWLRTLWF